MARLVTFMRTHRSIVIASNAAVEIKSPRGTMAELPREVPFRDLRDELFGASLLGTKVAPLSADRTRHANYTPGANI